MFFQNISCSIINSHFQFQMLSFHSMKKHLRHKKYFLGEYWYSLKLSFPLKTKQKPNQPTNQKTTTKKQPSNFLKKLVSIFTSYVFILLCLYSVGQKSWLCSIRNWPFFFCVRFSWLLLINAQNYGWKWLFFE